MLLWIMLVCIIYYNQENTMGPIAEMGTNYLE